MGGSYKAIPLKPPRANIFPIHMTMAKRRIYQKPFFAVFVALSVALTVAVSYIIAVLVSQNVAQMTATAALTPLPYDAFVLFPQKGMADKFITDAKHMGRRIYLTKCPVVQGESQFGPVTLVGTGKDLPLDTASLLGMTKTPPDSLVVWVSSKVEPSQTSQSSPGSNSVPVKTYGISNQARAGFITSQTRLEWTNVTVNSHGADDKKGQVSSEAPAPLEGWVSVNPQTIQDLPGSMEAVLITFDSIYDTDYLINAIYNDLNSILRHYPGTVYFSPRTGQENLKREAGHAFSLWHMVSVIVLLACAASISCVLTVSFLGRKRSLGIMRVLGTTIKDLRNMMIIEASYLGIPGIILGLIGGSILARLFLDVQQLSTGAATIGILMGIGTMATGVWLPLRLVRNASCDQLLNNRPVYVMSNPSCANCGLCGGV